MSKVDAMRALRESRMSAAPAVAAPARVAKQTAPPTRVAKAATAVVEPSEESCGHRSMNGRSCTRESGHAEKNHRYS